MRPAALSFALALLAGAACAQYAELTPRPDPDAVLLNPHMGLYVMGGPGYQPSPSEWFMKDVDICYVRDDWAKLNPGDGVYKFGEYFGPIFDYWVKQCGKRVAFRFMSENMHSNAKYVSPQWIFDKGIPGVHHVGLYTPDQIDPVFWDGRYLDIQCEFIKKLGSYLDGRPGLEFIDIGCIGEWGEMHLMRWTPQQLEQTGFTETKYARAYRRVIDAFANAFPHTRVFLNVGGQDHLSIDDYAAIRGINFRQDGLTPDGASYNCGEWLYQPYSRRGTVCQFEFCDDYGGMVKKGWDLHKTVDRGLAAPISYLNTNLCDLSTAPPVVREELLRAARKIGYRFVVTKVRYRPEFHLDGRTPGRILVETTWRNDGVAPCYDSLATEWTLVDASDKAVVTEVTFPQVPTTQWRQGEEQTLHTLLRVPGDLVPGLYRLKVAVLMPETGRRIFLGLAGADAVRRYTLCTLHGVATPASSGVVYEEGFEGAAPAWGASSGITATVDSATAHAGKASLLVTGKMGVGWNYAAFRLPKPLLPGAKYRLSGWMRVDNFAGIPTAPYLKIGVNAADGHWITNYTTNAYDLGKLGTWQYLEGVVECPADGATGDLCIEKGQLDGDAALTLHLDDLKLQLLESP